MTHGLAKRIATLEHAEPVSLPLDIRAWLGDYLTEAERASLAIMPGSPRHDRQDLPADFKQWLDQRIA